VLNAQRHLFQAEFDYLAARYNYIINGVLLHQATSTLTRDVLAKGNAWLTNSDTVPPPGTVGRGTATAGLTGVGPTASGQAQPRPSSAAPRETRALMSGNSFGKSFVVTSFGESHGPAIGGIVDGCPPGLPLSEADLQHDLDRARRAVAPHHPAARAGSGAHPLRRVRGPRPPARPSGC
jgi:hypothetical protein